MNATIRIDDDGLQIDWTPNPGSPEALAAGCKCPRMDNHDGRGIPSEDGPLFWINEACPLHGKESKQ